MAASQTMTATTNGNGATVRLTIPARAEYITLCRLALTGIARVRELPDEVLADLKLALTEAASNSVRHAYSGQDDAGVVEISYELHEDRLIIEVADNGQGFDPSEREEPSELTEGGLGIAIIRALCDELEIRGRDNGGGSRLRFVKFL